MPFRIVKRDDRWCVVREGDARRAQRTLGCHETREKAERQLRIVRAQTGE